MGNSSSKDERKASKPSSLRYASQQAASGEPSPSQLAPGDRLAGTIYTNRNGSARGSSSNLAFLHIGRGDRQTETIAPERPRETKQEREARRVERERQARLKERERSLREEHVDGGYLVTLGVYTGAEDFSKPVVRQLQIERRLAPFWKGLDDHSDSWTEAQLVAAARGLPIPKPDEVPAEMARSAWQQAERDAPRASEANLNSLTVPITSRSQSYQSDKSANLSSSHPAFSISGPSSPTSANSSNPLFRGRAKTLASTLTGKGQSPDISPQEMRLPNNPNVNGQPLEAYLYKDAEECPICFMYYPPYLNKTRCCNQAICSECFVQIKRPDPHPPEHEQPGEQRSPEEEAEMLVSEVAACPYCVMPEFGVTYDPPPLKRGLAYSQQQSNPFRNPTSANASSTSLAPPAGRRRATSLSANDSRVITTDRVRPDWKKKLDDARAHALRRSAAATALHNAAYVLGNQGDASSRTLLGRRRRTLFGDSPNASGSGTPREGDASGDLVSGRTSSRRNRVEDLEDLMMMEAIRLSLAAEEGRKRKEEKELHKDAKKKAKADKKEEKKAEKAFRKGGAGGSLYHAGTNESSSTWASTSMARSSSNLGSQPIPEEQMQGKGKQPVQDFAGFNPMSEPTSTLNRDVSPEGSTAHTSDPQRHLEESRANLQPPASAPINTPANLRASHLRELSNASSAASSFIESPQPGSLPTGSNMPTHLDVTTAGATNDNSNLSSTTGTPAATASSAEPMFNFRSLAAMIGKEEGDDHVEHAGMETEPTTRAEEELKEPSPTASPGLAPTSITDGTRSRGNSGESSASAPPPIYVEHPDMEVKREHGDGDDDEIQQVPQSRLVHDPDRKEVGGIDVHPRSEGRKV
ncbi:hypothetical protein CLAFUW4_11105 [Fulvia fulva]|uniref:Protein sip5 n=1 Tax=Passalora fulva TaxID=5499 RepID=A0A9Q8URQ0_PASFU|nr:uncharacterized protein CLAFUR5_10148 [Fulvia fulva]KAK4619726.1 hypothetical protein CLAFUR4_11110 [Fulvia fulva]KAK4621155.1 hypothetical protein CLAFUR0_11116 [Fulvia fulva]UJO19947.1 hypothetical protein CLAFUR5_10148 [Fulvia fulva]WPV17288.1 hypothetical protein CLAFUW4_11105 [Fulvia fulva]WPV31792.1 hypothetical protein CLAFUW7_11101 [Fulvia fulva]